MITDRRKFTAKWPLYEMSSFSFLPFIKSIQSLSSWMYATHQKGTYPNFRLSLTVTVDVLLSHGAKVNKPMWAWQLWDVASVST